MQDYLIALPPVNSGAKLGLVLVSCLDSLQSDYNSNAGRVNQGTIFLRLACPHEFNICAQLVFAMDTQ